MNRYIPNFSVSVKPLLTFFIPVYSLPNKPQKKLDKSGIICADKEFTYLGAYIDALSNRNPTDIVVSRKIKSYVAGNHNNQSYIFENQLSSTITKLLGIFGIDSDSTISAYTEFNPWMLTETLINTLSKRRVVTPIGYTSIPITDDSLDVAIELQSIISSIRSSKPYYIISEQTNIKARYYMVSIFLSPEHVQKVLDISSNVSSSNMLYFMDPTLHGSEVIDDAECDRQLFSYDSRIIVEAVKKDDFYAGMGFERPVSFYMDVEENDEVDINKLAFPYMEDFVKQLSKTKDKKIISKIRECYLCHFEAIQKDVI